MGEPSLARRGVLAVRKEGPQGESGEPAPSRIATALMLQCGILCNSSMIPLKEQAGTWQSIVSLT